MLVVVVVFGVWCHHVHRGRGEVWRVSNLKHRNSQLTSTSAHLSPLIYATTYATIRIYNGFFRHFPHGTLNIENKENYLLMKLYNLEYVIAPG